MLENRKRHGSKSCKPFIEDTLEHKNPVSARLTENRKELEQTMVRLDFMPIIILNQYKYQNKHAPIRSNRTSAQVVSDTQFMQPIIP